MPCFTTPRFWHSDSNLFSGSLASVVLCTALMDAWANRCCTTQCMVLRRVVVDALIGMSSSTTVQLREQAVRNLFAEHGIVLAYRLRTMTSTGALVCIRKPTGVNGFIIHACLS